MGEIIIKEYVIVKDGKVIEKFDNLKEEVARYLELIKSDEVFGYREIREHEK